MRTTEKSEFGIIEATPSLPARDLLKVPHKGNVLTVSYSAFGPETYSNNLNEMSKLYSHSKELPKLSFGEPTTSESISVVSYDVNRIKREILDPSWLQLGKLVRTSEGVFVNVPKDNNGNTMIDEKILKSYLNNCEKFNGIWLYQGKDSNLKDFSFAPYETFKKGVQESEVFVRGGLARLLEHSGGEIAENLKKMSSKEFYKLGIDVWGFDEVENPVLRVAGLYSSGDVGGGRLGVGGGDWGVNDGYVFGVLKKTGKDTRTENKT